MLMMIAVALLNHLAECKGEREEKNRISQLSPKEEMQKDDGASGRCVIGGGMCEAAENVQRSGRQNCRPILASRVNKHVSK